MGKLYWMARQRSAVAMARRATDAETRLIHYQLAGLYSIKAAHCAPFLLNEKGPSTGGEAEALHGPPARPGSIFRPLPNEPKRGEPAERR